MMWRSGVDEDFQVIVANDLTANASDQGVMLGLIDQVEGALQAQPSDPCLRYLRTISSLGA